MHRSGWALVAILVAIVAASGATAVHSAGFLELDGGVVDAPGGVPHDWDALFDVNVRATWLLAKAAHDALAAAQGAIVVTGSMSGSNAHANLGAYGPTKAAVIMLMRVLAQEFGRQGIRVNAVSPGMVRTGMTEPVYKNEDIARQRADLVPLGRVAAPEDIADAIAFLLGPDARYVNGHDLVVDGGVAGNFLGRLPGIASIPRG